ARAARSVRSVVRPGCGVMGRRGTGSAVVAEPDAPEAVDRDRPSGRVAEATRACPRSIGLLRVGVDLAVAEVADQQIAAEGTEVRRRACDAPGCVELAVRRDPCDQLAAGVECIDHAKALMVHLVVA